MEKHEAVHHSGQEETSLTGLPCESHTPGAIAAALCRRRSPPCPQRQLTLLSNCCYILGALGAHHRSENSQNAIVMGLNYSPILLPYSPKGKTFPASMLCEGFHFFGISFLKMTHTHTP